MEDKTLLERLSADPDAVDELSREELEAAKAELSEVGREQAGIAKDNTQPAEDRKTALEAAAEASERLTAVKARLEEFAAEDADMETKAAELEAAFDEPVAEEPEPIKKTEKKTTETTIEETTEEESEEVTDEAIADMIESETVVVAANPSMGALAKRIPKPETPSTALVASAGPGVGGEYARGFSDPEEIAKAAIKLWNGYGASSRVDAQAMVASFDTGSMHRFEVTGDAHHDGGVVDELIKDYRGAADMKALVAATGICAPAQPVYDFFGLGSMDGMIRLPSVNASRGALTYPVSTTYADVIANATWTDAVGQIYTNADSIAGTTKAVYAIECPDTFTCTVEAYPVILQFGNFMDRFYPEAVAHAISQSNIYHAHFVNGNLINDMVAAAVSAGGGDTGGGGLVNVANLINFEAMKYRDTYRLDMDARLELVAPAWVRDALVADLVARHSTTDFGNARGRVDAIWGSLNLDVQWVQDWQSPGDAGDGGWRTAADFLLFAPGVYVRLDGGTLDLGIVRDSTLNAANVFQTFTESFEAVCNIGPAVLIDDVTICPRGRAALDVALDCNPGFGS